MLAQIIWDVKPSLFSVGNFEVRYYSLLFALGFIVSYLLIKKLFKREGLAVGELDNLLIYVVVGALAGARLGHCFFYDWAYFSQHPLEIILPFKFSPAFKFTGYQGLASHGGAIGILLSLWLFVRKSKVIKNYLKLLDFIAIPTALVGSLIRFGNLMNSEIYGHPTDLPWGVMFVQNGDTWYSHPTQIYESLAYMIIFVILLALYNKMWKQQRHGFFLGLFLVLVFTFRFFIEFVKEVQVGFEQGMAIKMGQVLSIPFVLVGVALIIYSMRKKKAVE